MQAFLFGCLMYGTGQNIAELRRLISIGYQGVHRRMPCSHKCVPVSIIVIVRRATGQEVGNTARPLSQAPPVSVILSDIAICLVKKVLVLDLVFNIYHFAQGLLNLTLSGFGGLPAGEPHSLYYLVNIVDDPLYNYGCIFRFNLCKQLGQSCFCLYLFVNRINVLFCLDNLSGKGKQFFQEIQAVEKSLFMSFLELLQAFTQCNELWIILMLSQPHYELYLNLLGFLLRVSTVENAFENISIHHQSFNIVTHSFKVNILMNKLNCLGP